MKLTTGFFMAWSNFLAIPCPVKRWDDDLRPYMLAWLPTIGLLVGLLWSAVVTLLLYFGLPYLITAFLATVAPFLLCGFQHLDGFMDCCDAILSRRPLQARQAILKDPHTGAFAVISVVFLLLGYLAALSTIISLGVDLATLCLLPVVSRAVSGLCVLGFTPMAQSQYAGTSQKTSRRGPFVLLLVQLAAFTVVGLLLSGRPWAYGTALGVEAAATLLAVLLARRALGGMSGDIAGWGIVWGELCGLLAMAVL